MLRIGAAKGGSRRKSHFARAAGGKKLDLERPKPNFSCFGTSRFGQQSTLLIRDSKDCATSQSHPFCCIPCVGSVAFALRACIHSADPGRVPSVHSASVVSIFSTTAVEELVAVVVLVAVAVAVAVVVGVVEMASGVGKSCANGHLRGNRLLLC